ncbi:MAG: tRNA preQ1(34) S-adenosylmethionine ribosyltransferase-isomerase QueA, partial [Myxococcales bacterium]|nr:tRNA preQ1(34) S-adenosylmethionine ribosyltransferase-isomerase QueA [Myxococcales bacterium]
FAEGAIEAEVIERLERGEALVRLSARDAITLEDALELHGQLPLPPYVRRAPEVADRERYQTVFAAHPGAIAAPTAGLHLSATSLQALEAAGHRVATITLHVGPGTFRPVEAERLDAHPMHSERYEIPERTVHALAAARAEGRKILAVGTTVVRALEAAAAAPGGLQAGAARTALLIHPPYRFRVVDHLLTNFHLPRSTLLALVMAIGGIENIRAAYAEAIEAGYRFFSYGDAMLIRPESISASAPAIEAP